MDRRRLVAVWGFVLVVASLLLGTRLLGYWTAVVMMQVGGLALAFWLYAEVAGGERGPLLDRVWRLSGLYDME